MRMIKSYIPTSDTNEPVIRQLLQFILWEFEKISASRVNTEEPPPWGVWIRLLNPLPPDHNDIRYSFEEMLNQLQVVWFLNNDGLRVENVWAYHRFVTVHYEQPWCKRYCDISERSLPGGTMFHRIAISTIAPYQDSTDWYLDYQWGGLFGRGYRYEVNTDRIICNSRLLWIS